MVHPQKRIAIFMPSLFGGGGQRSMINLANGMADYGYAVDLVLAQVEGPFLSEVRSPVRVVDLKASRALTSLPALVRYLRTEQPEAMLSVFGYVNIVASWAWRLAGVRTRLLLNEQNTVSLESGNATKWRGRLVPWLIKRFYPWASGIVVVSHGVRDDMAQLTKIPRERITVIYNPSVLGEGTGALGSSLVQTRSATRAGCSRALADAKRLSDPAPCIRQGAEESACEVAHIRRGEGTSTARGPY
jgi:hypothetical protein